MSKQSLAIHSCRVGVPAHQSAEAKPKHGGRVHPPHALILFVMIVTLGATAFAQPTAAPTQQVSITISPAAAAIPALRYRLIPPLGQQTSGNAATQYLMAFELLPHSPTP